MRLPRLYIPHPAAILFSMLVLAGALSYLIPAGKFERITVDGREKVVPGSYQVIESSPLGLLDLFMALPLGFKTAVDIIFIVLASGIMFGFLERSGAVENAVGTLVKQLGLQRRFLIVVVMTFVFGALGVFVGYENNIAMIPIAALLSMAIGGDLILAAGISVAAVTIGFGLSPVNPYTIGTGHRLAELPLFSGALLRSILCFSALSALALYNVRYFKKILRDKSAGLGEGLNTDGFQLSKAIADYRLSGRNVLALSVFVGGLVIMIYGVFAYKWYINHISAIFCMTAIVLGLVNRNTLNEFGEITLKSVAVVAPGAFMVGFATSIKVALEMGQVSDTIAHHLSQALAGLPLYASAVGMTGVQSLMNFLIPSGSGQALATLPVLLPVGEVLGLTRQTTILAYQIGDGLTNLVNPALGGLIAMLSLCRAPFDRWLRFIFPLLLIVLGLAIVAVLVSVAINYGPF
ncbi:MAG: YfcC family protein [Saprospiraceae bacterium]|nr:YfcC family protein [Saprospiraceae bacterium]